MIAFSKVSAIPFHLLTFTCGPTVSSAQAVAAAEKEMLWLRLLRVEAAIVILRCFYVLSITCRGQQSVI